MERNVVNKTIGKAVAACIALGCLPAYAQNFNPPGDHTWVLNSASNSGVANVAVFIIYNRMHKLQPLCRIHAGAGQLGA